MKKEDKGLIFTEPSNDIVNDASDPIVQRMGEFREDSYSVMSEEINSWQNGQEMLEKCYSDEEDLVELYNPTMLIDINQRFVDNLHLAEYILRIPGSTPTYRQIVRDAITQQEQVSGLTSMLRDDDKGAMSWSLLGQCILWWGSPSDEEKKRGIAIKFQTVRLTQAYFSSNATRLRDYNGNPEANEVMLVFEDSYDEVLEMFPPGKGKGSLTGSEFGNGRLPFSLDDREIQSEGDDEFEKNNMVERAYYYNLAKGIFKIVVGKEATIVEEYDDNDPKLPDYPFKIDGMKYAPVEVLRCFPVIGKFYSKGIYHRFGKIAKQDATRRNMAHRYADQNINPDRFAKMKVERYATFMNDVDAARQLTAQGEDAYVQLNQDEDVQMGDLRTAPLTQEFERMKMDDIDLVRQGGIGITDINYPSSERATVVVAEERNKNRLANHVVKINAGASIFIRRIIVDFMQKNISKKNEVPVATNTKARMKQMTEDIVRRIAEMEKAGEPKETIKKFVQDNAPEGEEAEIPNVTVGMVSEYLKKNHIYFMEDFSAWENVGYKLSKINAGLNYAAGTPKQIELQKEGLAALGFDALSQELMPTPELQESPTASQAKQQQSPQGQLLNSLNNAQQATGVSPQM